MRTFRASSSSSYYRHLWCSLDSWWNSPRDVERDSSFSPLLFTLFLCNCFLINLLENNQLNLMFFSLLSKRINRFLTFTARTVFTSLYRLSPYCKLHPTRPFITWPLVSPSALEIIVRLTGNCKIGRSAKPSTITREEIGKKQKPKLKRNPAIR